MTTQPIDLMQIIARVVEYDREFGKGRSAREVVQELISGITSDLIGSENLNLLTKNDPAP